MDRRFLTVLGVSLVFALLVSSIFYQISSRAAAPREAPRANDMQDLVVAAKALTVGVSIKPDDIRVAKVPRDGFPKGAFHRPEEVIDRPVMSSILLDEPVLEGRLAARGTGWGIAPIIPVGMRAVSVRVNEVVGVAGFVQPGMHVDVLVTGRPPNDGATTMTATVLQDITVLSAGQSIQPDPRGQAINAPVVTLQVTPDQAETLTLAGTEARIQLVLRNGADKTLTETPGRRLNELYHAKAERPAATPRASDESPDAAPRPQRPRPAALAQAAVMPPPAAAAPPPDEVVIIRGNQKTVEVVSNARRPQ